MLSKQHIPAFIFGLICVASCHTTNNKPITMQVKKDTVQVKSGHSPVNGISMYYEIYGSGEPLVLIHGGGSTIQTSFATLIPMFSNNYQLIGVELQAHGRTTDRDAPESFEQDADDVVALLRNLGIAKASFFGFSNGGNTTMQIAFRHPEIVNKLIIASAFYKREGMTPGFFEGMQHVTIDHMPQSLKDGFLELVPDTNKLLNMFNKDKERMVNFKDWGDDVLRSIKAPSLIICGDQDVMTTEHAVAMSRLIPNARLAILPANHGSYIDEIESRKINGDSKMPAFTVELVERFLSGK